MGAKLLKFFQRWRGWAVGEKARGLAKKITASVPKFLDRILGTRFEIWRLNRQRKEVHERIRRAVAKARKARGRLSEEEEYEVYSEFSWEFAVIDCQVSHTITQALIDEANKLLLPVPPRTDEEKWEEGGLGYVLTAAGISELRSAIRREKREGRESFVQWISLLIGLLGALTGLIAVLKSG